MIITNQWRLVAWNTTLRPNALVLGKPIQPWVEVRAYARIHVAGLWVFVQDDGMVGRRLAKLAVEDQFHLQQSQRKSIRRHEPR